MQSYERPQSYKEMMPNHISKAQGWDKGKGKGYD